MVPLAQMQQGKSNAFVGWHLSRGYSPAEIVAALRERWPTELTVSINAALNRGQQAYARGLEQHALGPGEHLPLSGIPSGGVPGGGVRYYVEADLADVATGQVATRSIVVESASALTPEQLAGDILATIDEMYHGGQEYRGRNAPLGEVLPTRADVYAVERAAV